MAPNHKTNEEVDGINDQRLEKLVAPQADPLWTPRLTAWSMFYALFYVHLASLYSLMLLPEARWTTLVFMYLYFISGCLSITMGAHRLWSHKTYKARLPLQILLMLCFSSVSQLSLVWWVRTHRQHHKYSDTDADPHNATRGLFFSHIGWLMYNKHPEVIRRRPFVEMADIDNDLVLQFQKKYDKFLRLIMAAAVPTLIPWLLGESFFIAWHLNLLRLTLTLHVTALVNSFAHRFGSKPYDKSIAPVQSLHVSFFAFGEGFHNFHHVFPWDYRVAELGNNRLNFTTLMIDFFAKINWAYDLKTVSEEMVRARSLRTGDGTDSWGNPLQYSH